jgi:hypothetical protein
VKKVGARGQERRRGEPIARGGSSGRRVVGGGGGGGLVGKALANAAVAGVVGVGVAVAAV